MKVFIANMTYANTSVLTAVMREAGHVVDELSSVTACVAALRCGRYAATLLDVGRHDVDESRAVRLLRAAYPSAPLIVVFHPGTTTKPLAELEAFCDETISYELGHDELLSRVSAQVRLYDRREQELMTNGRIRLYLRQRRVLVDGKRVELTPTEGSLLEHLMSRCGEAVPRSELLSVVWDTHRQRGSNLVDVYVARLRRRLGDAGRAIQTVRSVGYRLLAQRAAATPAPSP